MIHHSLDSKCPHCGYVMDRTTGLMGPEAPKPGDYSICFQCYDWSTYQDDLSLRTITAEEIADMPEDVHSTLVRATKAIQDAKSRRGM